MKKILHFPRWGGIVAFVLLAFFASSVKSQNCAVTYGFNNNSDTDVYSINCGLQTIDTVSVFMYQGDIFIMDGVGLGNDVNVTGAIIIFREVVGPTPSRLVIPAGDSVHIGGDLIVNDNVIIEVNGILDIDGNINAGTSNNVRIQVGPNGILRVDGDIITGNETDIIIDSNGLITADELITQDDLDLRIFTSGEASFATGMNTGNDSKVNITDNAGQINTGTLTAGDDFELTVNGGLGDALNPVMLIDVGIGAEIEVNGGSITADSLQSLDDLRVDLISDSEVNFLLGINTGNGSRINVISDESELNVDGLYAGDEFDLLLDGIVNVATNIELGNQGSITVDSDGVLSADTLRAVDQLSLDISGIFNVNVIIAEDQSNFDIDGTLDAGDVTLGDQASLDIGTNGLFSVDDFYANDNAIINVDGVIRVEEEFELRNNAIFSTGDDGRIGGPGVFITGTNGSCSSNPGRQCPTFAFDNCSSAGSFCQDLETNGTLVPFPVVWLAFDYEVLPEGVNLIWQTAEELNNERFEIERKHTELDSDFQKIGEIAGAGTTEEVQAYEFFDSRAVAGTNLYRIKQVDFDGQFEYSRLIEVRITRRNLQDAITVYPNPLQEMLYADILPTEEPVRYQLEILNMQGQVLRVEELHTATEYQKIEMNVSDLPSGMYVYRIRSSKKTQHGKLIKE